MCQESGLENVPGFDAILGPLNVAPNSPIPSPFHGVLFAIHGRELQLVPDVVLGHPVVSDLQHAGQKRQFRRGWFNSANADVPSDNAAATGSSTPDQRRIGVLCPIHARYPPALHRAISFHTAYVLFCTTIRSSC